MHLACECLASARRFNSIDAKRASPRFNVAAGWSKSNAAERSQRITLTNFTIPAQSFGPLPATTPLRITLGLRVRNEALLNSAILAVNTPGSPSFRNFLKPAQFNATYAPRAAQLSSVKGYLKRMGFTHMATPSNRFYVVATGTAAQTEAAFNTTLWQYEISGISVQAQIQPPSAEITTTPNSGPSPLTVSFRAGGSRNPNTNDKITQYSFNFGDEVRW